VPPLIEHYLEKEKNKTQQRKGEMMRALVLTIILAIGVMVAITTASTMRSSNEQQQPDYTIAAATGC
jgi:flagellar basal body-associated protein FliL